MLKYTLLFLSCLATASCGSFRSSDKQTAELYMRMGTSQLEGGAYPQALSSLLKAESLDPGNPVIQNNLGIAYFVREHYEESENHFKKALALSPAYTEARNNLSRVLIETERPTAAIKELNIAVNDLTYSNPEKPLLNLGIAYFNLKNFEVAKTYLLKSLDIQRDNCLAHSYYGRCFYEERDFSRAAEELDRAVGFCQRALFDEPHYYSALSYYELGQKDKAVARLEEVLKLYPHGKYVVKAKSMLEVIRR